MRSEQDRPTTSSDRCRIDPTRPCGSCSAPGPDQCPYMYLLSDLFTYYEHDPDLHHDDDEGDAPADPPADPPDLTHIAVVPS
jgi:hypothetical protein